MWSSGRILLAFFMVLVTYYLPFLATVIHELGHLIVKLVSGVSVSEFSVGNNGGEVLLSFVWNEIFFLIKEGFNTIGGYVSYDPRTVPNAYWGMFSAFAGAFLSLNFLIVVLWGWVRFFGYGIGFFHFYVVVYIKFFRWLKYMFYPPSYFRRLKEFTANPAPKNKRLSFFVFMVLEKWRLWFLVPFFLILKAALVNFSNLMPMQFEGGGFSDGASLFAYFFSLFDPTLTPYMKDVLGVTVVVANAIASILVVYLIVFWMVAYVRRPKQINR